VHDVSNYDIAVCSYILSFHAYTMGRNPNKTGLLSIVYTNQHLLYEQLENQENTSLGIPRHTMRHTRLPQNGPVNLVNEYANEPAS
jgi:hypothetical protein